MDSLGGSRRFGSATRSRLAWRGMSEGLRRGFLVALFALLPYGILVQAVGVYSTAALKWNGDPVSVDQATWRVWDVADNPISRGLGLSRAASQ